MQEERQSLSSPSTSSQPSVGPSANNSLVCTEAAEGNSEGDLGSFALPDRYFIRGSYQIWKWCWCCFRRKMWVFFPSFSHLVLSDSLPGNKDGNSWISHGNIRTILLSFIIQKSKTEEERTLCSLEASEELSVITSVLFNCLFAIMEKLYLGSAVLNW